MASLSLESLFLGTYHSFFFSFLSIFFKITCSRSKKKQSNYFFAYFFRYVFGSWVGMAPATFIYIFIPWAGIHALDASGQATVANRVFYV